MTGPVRRARSARRMVTTSFRAYGLERDARPCHRGESRSHERVLARGLTPGPEPSLACTAKRRLRPRRVAGADRSSGRRALPRGVRRRPSRGRRWREHHAATPRMSTCRHRRATLLEARSTTTCARSVRVGASAAAGSRWLLHVPAAGPWRSHEEAGRRCLDGTRDPYRGKGDPRRCYTWAPTVSRLRHEVGRRRSDGSRSVAALTAPPRARSPSMSSSVRFSAT